MSAIKKHQDDVLSLTRLKQRSGPTSGGTPSKRIDFGASPVVKPVLTISVITWDLLGEKAWKLGYQRINTATMYFDDSGAFKFKISEPAAKKLNWNTESLIEKPRQLNFLKTNGPVNEKQPYRLVELPVSIKHRLMRLFVVLEAESFEQLRSFYGKLKSGAIESGCLLTRQDNLDPYLVKTSKAPQPPNSFVSVPSEKKYSVSKLQFADEKRICWWKAIPQCNVTVNTVEGTITFNLIPNHMLRIDFRQLEQLSYFENPEHTVGNFEGKMTQGSSLPFAYFSFQMVGTVSQKHGNFGDRARARFYIPINVPLTSKSNGSSFTDSSPLGSASDLANVDAASSQSSLESRGIKRHSLGVGIASAIANTEGLNGRKQHVVDSSGTAKKVARTSSDEDDVSKEQQQHYDSLRRHPNPFLAPRPSSTSHSSSSTSRAAPPPFLSVTNSTAGKRAQPIPVYTPPSGATKNSSASKLFKKRPANTVEALDPLADFSDDEEKWKLLARPVSRKTPSSSLSVSQGLKRRAISIEDDDPIQLMNSPSRFAVRSSSRLSAKRHDANRILFSYPPEGDVDVVTIRVLDTDRCGPGQFLNDSIVAYATKKHFTETASSEAKERIHLMSSFFFTRMDESINKLVGLRASATSLGRFFIEEDRAEARFKVYQKVRSWSRGVDIFSKRFVVFPINKQLHWSLAIVRFDAAAGDNPPTAEASSPISKVNIFSDCIAGGESITCDAKGDIESKLNEESMESKLHDEPVVTDINAAQTIPSTEVAGLEGLEDEKEITQTKTELSAGDNEAVSVVRKATQKTEQPPKATILTFDSLGDFHDDEYVAQVIRMYLNHEWKARQRVLAQGQEWPLPRRGRRDEAGPRSDVPGSDDDDDDVPVVVEAPVMVVEDDVDAFVVDSSEEHFSLNSCEVVKVKAPEQKDMFNCGVFVIRYIQEFLDHFSEFQHSPKALEEHYSKWRFPSYDANRLREAILKSIEKDAAKKKLKSINMSE